MGEQYVAFFDSDDIWLPDYLMHMTRYLAQTPDLSWLFCACKRVNLGTGLTLLESTHLDESTGQKAGFYNLSILISGDVNVFADNEQLAHYQIDEPLNAGFQNSVVKSDVIKKIAIPHYRIGEDRFFLLGIILNHFKVGFIEDVLVIYSVHQSNISDTNSDGKDIFKSIEVQRTLAESYKCFAKNVSDRRFRYELLEKAVSILFWNVAYNGYSASGRHFEAAKIMLTVLFSKFFSFKFLKTFFFEIIKAFRRIFRYKN